MNETKININQYRIKPILKRHTRNIKSLEAIIYLLKFLGKFRDKNLILKKFRGQPYIL